MKYCRPFFLPVNLFYRICWFYIFRFFREVLKLWMQHFKPLCMSPLLSSHHRCSMKKGVLGNLTKSTGKQLCQSLFFSKVTGLWPATLVKKRLWHRCFPVNFKKFLRKPFLLNTSGQLLQHCVLRYVPMLENFLIFH